MKHGKKPRASQAKRVWHAVQTKIFPPVPKIGPVRVCVQVPAFPHVGGIMTVLKGIAHVTGDVWDIEYLTQHVGENDDQYVIHRFGTRHMTPLYFPFAWLYVAAGTLKFLSLMRRGAGYALLIPQDGVFGAAMACIAGKLTGVRVVCIDHAEISLFTPRNSRIYRAERIAAIGGKNWPRPTRLLARQLLRFYWPSRMVAVRIAARLVDQYLIPGVAGDSIEEGCKIVGIPLDRVTRFASMVNLNHHTIPDGADRTALRRARGLSADDVVITIAARLAPEKGLDVALASINKALSGLSPAQRKQVRVVIAGDGPLRKSLEDEVRQLGLEHHCLFWGERTTEEVIELLGISDIFLYTSRRGACMAMAVLEAMASACAVIASTEPLANAVLLADGRGCIVPDGDVDATSEALLHLLKNAELCRHMGLLAREYISTYHSPARFRQTLLRATGCIDLDGGGTRKMLATHQQNMTVTVRTGDGIIGEFGTSISQNR